MVGILVYHHKHLSAPRGVAGSLPAALVLGQRVGVLSLDQHLGHAVHFEFELHVAVGRQQARERLQDLVVLQPLAVALGEGWPLHLRVQAPDEVVEDVIVITRVRLLLGVDFEHEVPCVREMDLQLDLVPAVDLQHVPPAHVLAEAAAAVGVQRGQHADVLAQGEGEAAAPVVGVQDGLAVGWPQEALALGEPAGPHGLVQLLGEAHGPVHGLALHHVLQHALVDVIRSLSLGGLGKDLQLVAPCLLWVDIQLHSVSFQSHQAVFICSLQLKHK